MNRKKISPLAKYGIPFLCFVLPLFLLGIINIFVPDKEVSEKENRSLEAFPALSFGSFFSGEFADKFQIYFSDQFFGRNFWQSANTFFITLYSGTGKNEIISLDRKDDFAGQALNQPHASANEPLPEPAHIDRPSDEDITQEKNYIIIDKKSNRAMELYAKNLDANTEYANIVSKLQLKAANSQVYCLVAPTSVEFYSSNKYKTAQSSQKESIADIYEKLTNGAKSIDAYSYIAAHVDDYLYFRTDHHWTARGAYHAYTAFCKTAELEALPLAEPTGQLDGFVGSLHRISQNSVLKSNPDFLEYFIPETAHTVSVWDGDLTAEPRKIPLISTNIADESLKYLAFLEGDHSLVKIDTEATSNKTLLVIKESFGNSMIPFLINHYKTIYVIDPRKNTANIPKFIEENKVDDVLCINYMFVPTNKTFMTAFKNSVGD